MRDVSILWPGGATAGGQIEHFVDPQNKRHPKFAAVAGKELVLFGRVSVSKVRVCSRRYRSSLPGGCNEIMNYFLIVAG